MAKFDFLKEIIIHKKKINREKSEYYSIIKNKMKKTKFSRYGLFRKMISRPGKINLIAEIKKASPSKGMLRNEFDILAIAQTYVEHKAAAISVLTEDKYFLGKPIYIKRLSDEFKVAFLTKDFIIEDGQIYEAAVNGASAVLLIVNILTDAKLKKFLEVAAKLDLDCLVEVHDKKELDRALKAKAEIIGINNRDLRSFNVTLKTSQDLIPKIPKGKVIVAESGITSYQEVKMLKDLGANAVLIGETFMKADDIGSKIKEIMKDQI